MTRLSEIPPSVDRSLKTMSFPSETGMRIGLWFAMAFEETPGIGRVMVRHIGTTTQMSSDATAQAQATPVVTVLVVLGTEPSTFPGILRHSDWDI
jgi:hypothetical protein